MHPPASVTAAVGRPHWLAAWLSACWAAGATLCMFWLHSDDQSVGWRDLVAGSLVLAIAVLSLWQWAKLPLGRLEWDGSDWLWQQRGVVGSVQWRGNIAVFLDLQGILLLRFSPDAGRAVWLWLDSGMCAGRWDPLRRAVAWSSRRSSAAAASQPDAIRL